MKQLIIFLLVSSAVFSQKEKNSGNSTKKDTLLVSKDSIVKPIKQALFSDDDLVIIDSLIVQGKLNSPLIDTLVYVINDKDIKEVSPSVPSSDTLKLRLSNLNEKTPFHPLSPYGVAKLYAHWITKVYRDAYNIFASNGILFNHESPRRGGTFVTKKIVSALCRIKEGKQNKLYLGNLNAKRDWGHAEDYCFAMWKILQQKKADDFVIATGVQYSIKQFINITAKKLNMKIKWKGKGLKEKAYNEKNVSIIECDKNYFRPLDVNTLLGDAKKARKKLKWKPKENIYSLIDEMILSEYLSFNEIEKK